MDDKTNPPTKAASEPAVTPDPRDDLKTLPLADVEKKLSPSPNGLAQAEATKRLAQYGPNEIEEKKQSAPEISFLLLGSHLVDD